jgi:hypothetical protein
MTIVKEQYTKVIIIDSGVLLKRADGSTDIIAIASLESLSIAGTITDGAGDQTFFDDFDPTNVKPPTAITDIAKNWKINYTDFGVARVAMADAVAEKGGFDRLSDFEKHIAARWFVAPFENRMLIITEDEDKENWMFLLKHTKPARDQRIEIARRKISYELITKDASDLYLSVDNYIRAFSIANMPDLIQWIGNELGTPYENDGFAQKPYFSAARRDMLIDVLKDGIYIV